MFRNSKLILIACALMLTSGCAVLFPKERVDLPEDTPPVATTPKPAPKQGSKPTPSTSKIEKKQPSQTTPASGSASGSGTVRESSISTDAAPVKEVPKEPMTPRTLAALELSTQAKALLAENKPDEAIRVLEKAMNLSTKNGETYYYLAEAWLMKENPAQAAEYNALAEIRFKNNSEWLERIQSQKLRIGR